MFFYIDIVVVGEEAGGEIEGGGRRCAGDVDVAAGEGVDAEGCHAEVLTGWDGGIEAGETVRGEG